VQRELLISRIELDADRRDFRQACLILRRDLNALEHDRRRAEEIVLCVDSKVAHGARALHGWSDAFGAAGNHAGTP